MLDLAKDSIHLCLSQQGKGDLEWTAGPRGERGRVAYLPAVWRWREACVNFSLVTEVPRCSCLSWTPHSMKGIPTKRALGYIPLCWEWASKEVGLEQDFLMSRDCPWRTACRVSWQIHMCSSWENEKLDIFSRFHIYGQWCPALCSAQLCLTLRDLLDCSPPRGQFLCPRDFLGKNTGAGYHSLLRDIPLAKWYPVMLFK